MSKGSIEMLELPSDLGGNDDAAVAMSEHDDRDRKYLARIGKRQVLKRNFGFISMLSFSCTVLSTWEGVLVLFASGFINGGPAAMLWQYIFIWGGTSSTFITIGELASMAPTAGGQYHWTAMLSPRSTRNFLSYLTGWMTVLAWVATITTGAFLVASMVQACVVINYPTYVYELYHTTFLTWAVILVCVFFNTVISSLLPKVESGFLVVHLLGFFGILIPLAYLAPKASAADVFSTFLNVGEWPTYGVSWMVGLLGPAFSFVGADAAVHMSEEISNPAVNVPRSIFASLVINGALGFGMLMALLFCLGDPNAALEAQTTIGFPFIEVFQSATNSVTSATGMTTILIALGTSATIGFTATASRMVWSFARDRGLPFSDLFAKVDSRSKIPLFAVAVSVIIPALLALINIGSTTVFNQVTSLSLAGFYSTYFIVCAMLLYCRVTGKIQPYRSGMGQPAYFDLEEDEWRLIWGPWSLPHHLGIANNILSCCYLIVVWFFSFWPPIAEVTPSTMSYTSLVFGGTVLYSTIYYVAWGRHQYSGPVIEVSG